MTAKKKRKIIFAFLAFAIISLAFWIWWANSALELNTYCIESEKLPSAFNGYRIACVSDLHNAEIGKDNKKLIELLKESNPDIIVITGDLVDSNKMNIEVALKFAESAMMIAPCYYVTGNHEAWLSDHDFEALQDGLASVGVNIMHDSGVILDREGDLISLVGIDDFEYARLNGGVAKNMDPTELDKLLNEETYSILLSHQPQFFEQYCETKFDLIISGHVHGGQFRIPFMGGLLAPDHSFFPDYYEGVYNEGETSMVVSRGIGNSVIPFRFNNRPEVVLIELKKG